MLLFLCSLQIAFPKEWTPPGVKGPFAPDQYVVQRSEDASFDSFETLPAGYTPSGEAWIGLDLPWSGAKPPYSREQVVATDGDVIATSKPLQPLDQTGNTFVVNGSPPVAGCGDLIAGPCSDIKTAMAQAPAGSTVYVAPGERDRDREGDTTTAPGTESHDSVS